MAEKIKEEIILLKNDLEIYRKSIELNYECCVWVLQHIK